MNNVLITHTEPKSPISECFRALRTNIQFKNSNKNLKTILVTSTVQSEGKSTVAVNLAVTFAQAGKKTIIVDADLRRARQHKIFGISQKPGLSNYLLGIDEEGNSVDEHISAYIKATEVENLDILPAGTIPPNPSELLAANITIQTIEKLKQVYDIIIFDGTPSVLVTDAIILSRIVDTTIILASYKETKMDSLQKIKKDIEHVGGNIAGVILNKYPISKNKYNDTYYYGNKGESSKIAANISNIQSPREATIEEPEKVVEEPKMDVEKAVEPSRELTHEKPQVNTREIEDSIKLGFENKLGKIEYNVGKIEYCIEKLDSKIDKITDRTKEAISEEVYGKIHDLNSRMKELEEFTADMEEETGKEVNEKVNELAEKIRELENLEANAKQTIREEISDRINKLSSDMKDLEISTVNIKADTSKELSDKINELSEKIKELENENANARTAVKEELSGRIEKLNAEIKETAGQDVYSEIDELAEKVGELKDLEANVKQSISEELNGRIDELSASIKELEEKTENEGKDEEISSKIEELSASFEGLEAKINSEGKNEELANQISELGKEINSLSTRIDEIPSNDDIMQEQEKQIESLKNRIEELEVIKETGEIVSKETEEKVSELNKIIEDLQGSLETAEGDKKAVESKLEECSTKISELENKIKSLENKQDDTDEEGAQKANVVDMTEFKEKQVWYTKPEKNVKLYEIEVVVGEESEQLIREMNDSMVVYEKKVK